MADAADNADIIIDSYTTNKQNEIRKAVSEMPKGNPGECDLCGEWSGRLVGGACAPCRDRHNLP